MNEIKLKIYSLILELRKSLYIIFEEDQQAITLKWNPDFHGYEHPDNFEMYTAIACCEHELNSMYDYLQKRESNNELENCSITFHCNVENCEYYKNPF